MHASLKFAHKRFQFNENELDSKYIHTSQIYYLQNLNVKIWFPIFMGSKLFDLVIILEKESMTAWRWHVLLVSSIWAH